LRVKRLVPNDVKEVTKRLSESGFDVWIVGGALRDCILGRTPKDWDLATDATPPRILELFSHVAPIGIRHGTVQVLTEQRGIEVTTTPGPGLEGILADLGRRDFTVNALALAYPGWELLDPFGGEKDLVELRLRAVGDARSRFREDPLRTLRAGRFMSTYGFAIEQTTFEAIEKEAEGLERVAQERIRDEILKMLLGDRVIEAFDSMRRAGVLSRVLPELLDWPGKELDLSHPLDIYHHSLCAVHYSPPRIRVRLAALFHDMGKPRVRRLRAEDLQFSGCCEASALIAFDVMTRWCMSNKEIREVRILVSNHLPREAEEWSDAALRRLIARVGPNLLEDLLDLAAADRLAMANHEASYERMGVLRSRIYEQLRRGLPLRAADLAVNGEDVMRILALEPGPLVGKILGFLHGKVLDAPDLNERKILMDFLEKEFHIEDLSALY